ncbi:MAG: hypothetical protein ACOYOE_15045, partial [Chlorobium sp.]
TENVYKWLFRVTDPQNNPFDVIFYVEQTEEPLLELPEHIEHNETTRLSEEIINLYTVGKTILWKHHPVADQIDDPARYLFEGKAFANMKMRPVERQKTRVQLDLKVDVRFVLYPAFRIVPQPILHAMTNAAISIIMQASTNSMFHSITRDFNITNA